MATADLARLLDARPGPVEVLAFGTPSHLEPAFGRARDQIVTSLAGRPGAPTLLFAHNRELPPRSERCVVIAGSLGTSVALGLGRPAPDTFEGRLGAAVGHGPLFTKGISGVTRVSAVDYTPLDAETVANADAIWHVDRFPPAAAALADRIRRLPGVEHQPAGPKDNVPDLAWDDWFFFVGGDRRHPFATIVGHDIPGFDEESRLDRVGVYRLNLDLGRREFKALFGYGPEEVKAHRERTDFAAFDRFVPHPVYAVQSWASVVNPGPRSADDVDRLLARAHGRHGRSRRGA